MKIPEHNFPKMTNEKLIKPKKPAKPKKEYTTLNGVQSSFIATVAVNKTLWRLSATDAYEWYLMHLERQGRHQTHATAIQYRPDLCLAFSRWIAKNVNKRPQVTEHTPGVDIQAAIEYLEERGYEVRKR